MECPCTTECKDCESGFRKIIDLKNAGLVIYRHTTHTEDVDTKTGNVEHAVDTTEDVYILHNTTDKDITSADYWPEIEQNTIKCPRCRNIKENARKLLKKGPTISGNDVKGICDHCKLKDTSCQECQDVVKRFVPRTRQPEQTDFGKERVKHWLGKIKLLLDDTSKDKKMDHSDIHTNQLYRNLNHPVREPDVEQLFGPHKLDSVSSIRPSKDKKKVTGQLFGPHKLDSVSSIRPSKDKKKVTGFSQLEKLEHPILFKDPLKRGVMSSFANEDVDTGGDFSKTMLHPQPEGVKHKIIKYTTPPNTREVVGQVDPLPAFEKIFEDAIPLTGTIQKASTSKSNHGEISQGHRQEKTDTKQRSMTAKYGIEKKFTTPHKQSPRDIHGRLDETNLNQKAHLYTKVKDQVSRHRKYNSTETLVTKVKGINLGHLQANDIIFPKRSHNKHIPKHQSSSELIKHTAHKLYVKAKEEKRVLTEDKQAKQHIKSHKIFGKTENIGKHSSSAARKGQKAPERAKKTQKDAQKAALIAEKNAQKAALIAEKNAQKAALIAEKNAKKAEKNAQKAAEIAEKNSKTAEKDAQTTALLAEKNSKIAEKNAQKAALLAEKNSKISEKNAQKAALLEEKNSKIAEKNAQHAALIAEKKSKIAEKDAQQAKNDARQARNAAQKDTSTPETDAQKRASEGETDAKKAALKREENLKKAELALEAARQAEINALKKSAGRDALKTSYKDLNEREQKEYNKQQKKDNMMKNANKDKIKASLPGKSIRTEGQTVYRDLDDLISKLVKLKQLAHEGIRHTSRDLRIAQNYIDIHCEQHTHRKNEHCLLCANSDIALEFASLCPDNEIKEDLSDIIVGQQILKFRPPRAQIEDVSEEKDIDKHKDISPDRTTTIPQTGSGSGYWRYSLSDRKFIDNGWTQLPTEKVVRKMNVYRMRPSRPEFDWFEHNRDKRLMQYDTGEKLAEFDDNGRGRWFYRNGRMALVYYDAEEQHAGQRFVVYSTGEPDERGRSRRYTLLATFDYLGNGIVFDHSGKIRLKYNQTEGVVLDRSIGPVSHWKWHALNDPPVLQQVMLDTEMPLKDPDIMKMGKPGDEKPKKDDEDMLAIEFDNIVKEKSKKLSQTFRPFQIRTKALKINEHFSLRVLDQATVYLLYRDGTTNLKLNIGMVLDNKEIVDTVTADVGDVSNNLEKLPARTESLAGLQKSIAKAQQYDRMRTERERKLNPGKVNASVDKLVAGISRPIPPQLLTAEPSGSPMITPADNCKCNRKPTATNVYYDTRFF